MSKSELFLFKQRSGFRAPASTPALILSVWRVPLRAKQKNVSRYFTKLVWKYVFVLFA